MSESLSIIIATYNRTTPLHDTLVSASQLKPKPFEILVVDQTPDLAADELLWRKMHVHDNPEVRFLSHYPANAQAARNKGLVEARGSVVMLMDDDVIVPSDLVEKHVHNYDDSSLAAVSGMILELGEEPTFEYPEAYRDPKLGFIFFPLNYGMRTELINLSSCNCSVRREHALGIGGFDENFTKTLFDDSDFSWRLHQYCESRGLKVIHDPKAWLTHLRVPSGGNRPRAKNKHVLGDRNAWYTWCYFHFQHWGRASFIRLVQRYRWWIWHRKNILHPWWLVVAHWELLVGVGRAISRIEKGPTLINMK
ncbi:glycosyltransferase [Gammaproteobacteria bacterium]|nr:glycosyltransferase [Gammaproteobacteria bacterium]